ncbi:MAG: tol-pal system-associated acyl-CoA thioesterase [Pseudomonadota bacterium]
MLNQDVWPVRVYYEDTDAGGVVYYANYLAYMERARTEWLRGLGFENSTLAEHHGVVFVVRRVTVDYLGPARLDDELAVTARVKSLRRASLDFEQQVLRGDECLCCADVRLVCVDTRRFRPAPVPKTLAERIKDGE